MDLINQILTEWAYRVHDGMPNPKNPLHITKLKESMEYLHLPKTVIDGFIRNMTEGDSWWSDYSPEQQAQYIKDHPQSKKAKDAKKDMEKKEEPSNELRNVDHSTVDKVLRFTKDEVEAQAKQKGEKGVGAGTAESRAGEAATHYAIRQILSDPPRKIEDIKNELLEIAKDKNTVLTKEWVNGAINCALYINEKYKDNIEDVVWDTPSGRKLINVEGHGTSSDMFITTKDGKRVGISLKKDGKVFILNGGYDKRFVDLVDSLKTKGLSEEKANKLIEVAGIDSYNKDRKVAFENGITKLIENKNLLENEINYFKNNLDEAKLKSKFGPGAEKYLKILQDSPGIDVLAEKAAEGTLTGDQMKAVSKLAKSSDKIKKEFPEIYNDMRGAEIKLTQRILKEAEDPEVEDALKGVVISGIHVESILGLDENPNLDEFITIYGEVGGSELSKETLYGLFGDNVRKLHESFKNSKDSEEKKKIVKEIRREIKNKIYVSRKDGARDGVIKIKHEDGTEYPVFTIKSRTKPIGTAPGLEMAQTNFMSNALKFGFNTDKWPDKQFNNFINKQVKDLYEDWDGAPPPQTLEQIKKLESKLR